MPYCPVCTFARSWTIRRGHRKCKRCRHEWSPKNRYPVPAIRLTRELWIALIDAFVDHDGGEYFRGNVHTQGIEGVWGYLKRKLTSMGGIRKQYLERFVGELVWRYSHRNMSRAEQIRALLDIL